MRAIHAIDELREHTEALGDGPGVFMNTLLHGGLLVPSGVPGVYGRSAQLEDTIERVDRAMTALGAADDPEVLRFPPLVPRRLLEQSGYLKSFPHLAGSVHSFAGDDRGHRALLRALEAREAWADGLPPTEVMLTPAACYPVYPALAGEIPEKGRLVDVMSYCFRHEPSDDPGRLQMFRMHEHVRVGDAARALAWRDTWIERAERFTAALGLDARVELASDPFFGRGGTMLAMSQRERGLKLEVVAPVASAERPTAIISLNYHQEHFGQIFGLSIPDGSPAHTACVGFGLERIALALYRAHGLDRARWPAAPRGALGL